VDTKVLVPPARQDTSGAPSIFLGGSITGAWDWQSLAIRLLRDNGFEGWIFNPRREKAFSEEPGIWEEQVDWEREHLEKATVILFWLPAGADALTSRWEIAEFAAKGNMLVVGIEDGVRRKKYIRYVLSREYKKNAMILDTLEEVCVVAARNANRNFKYQEKAT
jgi:hypothetical protein